MPAAPTFRPTAVLAVILVSYLMIVLDISIVITALPEIHDTLGFSRTGLSWVQNAYLLAFGGLLLLGARAGDLFGRRRMFLVGLAVFTVASLGVGSAQSEAWLLAGRALQGVGAAILTPSTLALLQTSFAEGPDRTRAVSLYAAVAGVGATAGLVLGGMFAGWLSWRVGFFVNVPIGVAMFLAAPKVLPETTPRPGRIDVAGALSSTLGMVALVYGFVRAADAGWSDPSTIAPLVAGIVLVGVFVAVERRAAQPVLPLRLFRNRERSGAYAARLLFLGGMVPFWFFTTQYLQEVAGLSPVSAGLAFLPTTVTNFASALAVPRLTRSYGNARVLAAGLLMGVIGMAWLAQVGPDTDYLTGVALPMALIGIGQGGVLGPLTAAGLTGVNADDAGAASGATNVAHQIGGSLGLGVLVAVFASADDDALQGAALLAHRIHAALTGGALLLAVSLLIVLLALVRPSRTEPAAAEDATAVANARPPATPSTA